ncbi:MAG: hypothetical protein HZB70_01995 [Candidatus Berkelbacteria bacterium]|nr:MAG: hypothetical protein HZB70_01995 [Candidatus Berkelbacteria bacterium]QQG51905.1 MAG: hypothetical protein HY845_01000 [Candidatus Berkelbacteria bacterium]
MKNSTFWMILSGSMGFAFFLIANFSHVFQGANQIAAVIQLAINVFVFVVYWRAYFHSNGLKKFIAFFGIVFPVVMASITIYRVLWPH